MARELLQPLRQLGFRQLSPDGDDERTKAVCVHEALLLEWHVHVGQM